MGSVVIAVGVAGLTAHCWLRTIAEVWINIHVLFGALLCTWLTVRIQTRVKQSPRMQPTDIEDMSRQHSRIAYLVLYAVIGIKLIADIGHAWSGGPGPFSLLNERFLSAAGANLFDPRDDYQMCLAAGLVALGLLRVRVSRLRMRSYQQALAPEQPSQP
jgi:cytochrome b561